MGRMFCRIVSYGWLGWVLFAGVGSAWGQSTKFSYRGRLPAGNPSADGWYDLRFTLYDAPLGGNRVAGPVTTTLPVQGGGYVADVDFGVVPPPGPSWLEVEVRPAVESEPFVASLPRQELVPVPYALQSAWSAAAGYAGEAVVARSLAAPPLPGTPGVFVQEGPASRPDLAGGVTWVDGTGAISGYLGAVASGQLTLSLSQPLRVTGSGMVLGEDEFPTLGPGTNRLEVQGSARFRGPVLADAGVQFPDGSRLSTGAAVVQPNVLWVSTAGDDGTAQRGDPRRPWRTIGVAVSNAVSGDAVLILPGRYQVAVVAELGGVRERAPIRLVGLTNVTVAGFGGIPEIYAPDFGDIIQVENCRDLRFRSLHLRSDASALPAPPHGQSAGISFVPRLPGSAYVLIEGCRFTGVPHAITAFAAPAVATDYLTVQNCTFEGCGWTTGVPVLGQDGGALTGFGNHLRFENNVTDRTVRGVEFFRFPGDPAHTNALITGNIFRNYWDCAVCEFDDGTEGRITLESVVIANNVFEDAPVSEPGGEQNGSAAVLINQGRAITIRGNIVRGGKLYGIKVSALTGPIEHIEIADNLVSGVAGRGIQVTDYGQGVQQVRVLNNRIWGNTGGGILAQGRYLDISFNSVSDNFPYGISITAGELGRLSADGRVFRNFLVGNTTGILLEGTTNLVVDANQVIDPGASTPDSTPAPVGGSGGIDPGRGGLPAPGPTGVAGPRAGAVTAWKQAVGSK